MFDKLDGFDEGFTYGSDVDFTWRLNDAGYRVLYVPEASLRHDYGAARRQNRRSYLYGKARARLYRKHRARRMSILRSDPIAVVYPLFLAWPAPQPSFFRSTRCSSSSRPGATDRKGLSRCSSITCGLGQVSWRRLAGR